LWGTAFQFQQVIQIYAIKTELKIIRVDNLIFFCAKLVSIHQTLQVSVSYPLAKLEKKLLKSFFLKFKITYLVFIETSFSKDKYVWLFFALITVSFLDKSWIKSEIIKASRSDLIWMMYFFVLKRHQNLKNIILKLFFALKKLIALLYA